MIKKTVTYENFNGEQVTEDLYFHLSNLELVELEQSTDGGMMQSLQALINAGNAADIIAMFRKLVGMAYGKKGDDGRTFVKDDLQTKAFLYSPAFDALFEELVDHPETAGPFIEGMVSKGLLARVEADRTDNRPVENRELPGGGKVVEPAWPIPDDDRPAWERENRSPTNKELQAATPDQLRELFRKKTSQGITNQ